MHTGELNQQAYSFKERTIGAIFPIKRANINAAYYSFFALLVYESIFWISGGYGGMGTDNQVGVSADKIFFLLYISLYFGIYNITKMKWKNDIPKVAYNIYVIYFVCNIIAYIRGVFSASDYYEWKKIFVDPTGGLVLFVQVFMVIGIKFETFRRIFKLILGTFIVGLFILPFQVAQVLGSEETFARLMVPSGFFLLLGPYLKLKNLFILFIIVFACCILTLEWRSMALRLILSTGIFFTFYFRRIFTRNLLLIILILCYLVPIYFTIDGIITGKSIFASESESNQSTFVSASGSEQSVAVDTRTFLYKEVLADLYETNSFIQGKGAVARYKSDSFNEGVEKSGRFSVEVGALKILMMTGLIGLILFGTLNFLAAYLAIKRSNNFLCKMLGLFLGTFWTLLFIENIYSYNLNFYLTWIFIGLCLSTKFRALTDREVKLWLKV